MAKHFQTKRGVLIECDIPIKQYILYLNEEDIKAMKPSFVVEDLDATHVVVSEGHVEEIREKVTAFIESNSRSLDK